MDRPTATAAPGRRERNKQRIRERVYQAALELFAEQGYDATSVDAIAERADVARGTFFNHFQRKEDLITEWGERRRARLKAELEGDVYAEGGEFELRLQRCMTVLSRINEEERHTTPAMLQAWVQAGQPLLEEPYAALIFAEIVERGRTGGEFAPGVDPVLVGNILRDTYLGALYRWARAENRRPLQGELEQMLGIILNGIRRRPEGPDTGSS
ncbi:TetR/AcrR family transcriptional regulator [Kitasatospora sp. GP82]|uniref:TetR/AcrR family transcriptional regulator n=1 Tax=Kitasatospora sp. GP82 TaxID=3035089 RepID=UPI00247673AD|nr:TetR/AcrR family transcriptional regulator [Kitasatospora sp. GP82]MDH6124598.1 AcrR family transcriptional regulator [Kitasatospora sp. GP82]